MTTRVYNDETVDAVQATVTEAQGSPLPTALVHAILDTALDHASTNSVEVTCVCGLKYGVAGPDPGGLEATLTRLLEAHQARCEKAIPFLRGDHISTHRSLEGWPRPQGPVLR